MCGIAGIVDLRGGRAVDGAVLTRMASAIVHRGPDGRGELVAPGVGLASRRLSIVGLADSDQPIFNEDRTVAVVFNGELFDYRERRASLAAAGHRFTTDGDTEVLVHLWEDHGVQMLDHVRGQFAFALFDSRERRLLLARDRVGICPLHWAVHGGWLYFGSEVKAILSSKGVPVAADERGLDHLFTFFALPARRTAFAGISALLPGHYLLVQLPHGETPGTVEEHRYWDLDFPDRGEEFRPADPRGVVDEFSAIFRQAVARRLRADVPVVGYLSGGIDSAAVVQTASSLEPQPIPSFTVKIASRRYDESVPAMGAARTIGSRQTVISCGAAELAAAYPALVMAADCPVVDTACAALYLLAQEVHRQGFKVALTGEGSDEALAGYPWFKLHRLMTRLDIGRFRPSTLVGRLIRRFTDPAAPPGQSRRIDELMGGLHAQSMLYHLVSLSRGRYYSDEMRRRLDGHLAYEDLPLDRARMARWHPLNQSIYIGYKTILPGLLLNHKGDRVAMAHSVETRYPFLDEELIDFCARLAPEWKLRSLRRDKHVLRSAAASFLPHEIVRRPKAMFRAPQAATFFSSPVAYVEQLLSRESLARTPYFNARQVPADYEGYRRRRVSLATGFREMGLTTVLAVQLWHHQYLGGGLCELPVWEPPK